MEFRYLITQNDDTTYDITFYLGTTAYIGPAGCKNYIEALRVIQLLQFPLTQFDLGCIQVAEDLGLEQEAA